MDLKIDTSNFPYFLYRILILQFWKFFLVQILPSNNSSCSNNRECAVFCHNANCMDENLSCAVIRKRLFVVEALSLMYRLCHVVHYKTFSKANHSERLSVQAVSGWKNKDCADVWVNRSPLKSYNYIVQGKGFCRNT